MMKENLLRRLLAEGKATLATRIESRWPLIVELIGSTGRYDYVEFVAEYAPFSQDDLENLARAAELGGLAAMIKVDYRNRGYVAQKAMASGFQAVNLTDHHNAEELAETLRLLRPDTPQDGGRFGYPNRRWIGYEPYAPQLEHARRVRETVVLVMIEKAEALDDIEAICRLPGVDMLQFGPSDYSMSKGWNAADHAAEVKSAERVMIAAALAHGIRPRAEIHEVADADYYLELGVRDFCIGDELRALHGYWAERGAGMRGVMR